MLPKRHRVDRKLFEHIWRQGTVGHTPHFIVKTLPATRGERVRVGVVVPKKLARQAVARAQLRRRVLGALTVLQREHALSGHSIFVLKNDLKTVSFSEIQQEIKGFLERQQFIQ